MSLLINAQNWLDQNYPTPSSKRSESFLMPSCDSRKKIHGHLNLIDFVNLRSLYFQNSNLNSIDVSSCPNLTTLYLNNNALTSLDLSNNLLLEIVDIRRNSIRADLNIFSHLTNLRELQISEDYCYLSSNSRRNTFSGSLSNLRNCQFLKELLITNQALIDGRLEELPSRRLKKFYCRGTVFFTELEQFAFSVEAWKSSRLVEELKEIITEEREINAQVMGRMDEWYWGRIESLEEENGRLATNLKEGETKVEEDLKVIKGLLEVMREQKENLVTEIDPILDRINRIVVNWGIFFEQKKQPENWANAEKIRGGRE